MKREVVEVDSQHQKQAIQWRYRGSCCLLRRASFKGSKDQARLSQWAAPPTARTLPRQLLGRDCLSNGLSEPSIGRRRQLGRGQVR